MKEFLAKLSLYDFLTTIILGGCIFAPFYLCCIVDCFSHCHCHCHCHCNCPDQFLKYIHEIPVYIQLGGCYVVGLVVHKFVESIDFSNCLNKCKCKRCVCLAAFCSMLCRNQKAIIERARKKVFNDTELSSDKIMSEYLQAYYDAMSEGKLNNVPKIESHSAFIKDLFYVLILHLILPYIYPFSSLNLNLNCPYVFIGMTVVLLLVARYNQEYKIHRLVWEYVKYQKGKTDTSESAAVTQNDIPEVQ